MQARGEESSTSTHHFAGIKYMLAAPKIYDSPSLTNTKLAASWWPEIASATHSLCALEHLRHILRLYELPKLDTMLVAKIADSGGKLGPALNGENAKKQCVISVVK
eukprot:6181476-Pleurochrysis_carterae.AAC.2